MEQNYRTLQALAAAGGGGNAGPLQGQKSKTGECFEGGKEKKLWPTCEPCRQLSEGSSLKNAPNVKSVTQVSGKIIKKWCLDCKL